MWKTHGFTVFPNTWSTFLVGFYGLSTFMWSFTGGYHLLVHASQTNIIFFTGNQRFFFREGKLCVRAHRDGAGMWLFLFCCVNFLSETLHGAKNREIWKIWKSMGRIRLSHIWNGKKNIFQTTNQTCLGCEILWNPMEKNGVFVGGICFHLLQSYVLLRSTLPSLDPWPW